MEPWRLSIHPIYGAIYRDGEFVQRGAILGLNTEANGVVVAPASGWVRIVRADPSKDAQESDAEGAKDTSKAGRYEYVSVEIWPQNRT